MSKPKWHHKLNRICKNKFFFAENVHLCLPLQATWTFCALIPLHFWLCNFYCVTSLWAKPLRNTECPHLDAMKNISLPLGDGCCQQHLHQLCVHSRGTNVVLFGTGDVSQVLSEHGAVHFLHQRPMDWSASCVITWELRWICSAAVVSCCCCECKLSYQFKARQWEKAIYVARLSLECFSES